MMSSPWLTSCCREVGRLKAYCLPKLGKLTASREEPGMLAVLCVGFDDAHPSKWKWKDCQLERWEASDKE